MTNEQQQKAIKKTSGPCIILAGAGTGKSFTIIEKVNYLVNETKIYKPDEILCLTFSNEATNSLNKKLQEKLKTTTNVVVKTFHSFCGDILRDDGHLIDIDSGFQILLPDDAKIIMHKYLKIKPYWANRYISTIHATKDFGLSLEQLKEHFKGIKKELLDLIPADIKKEDLEKYKDKLKVRLSTLHLNPKETLEERKETKQEKKEIKNFISKYDEYSKFNDFIDAWSKYEILKKERNFLDFSDLNYYVLKLFRNFDSNKYTEQFKYVFIDEFQDTNKLQFELINFIGKHRNITVVGDPNQSIYGFRGAYKESFDHFKQNFEVNEETDVFKLDLSYRSPNNVLNLSHDLIKNNYKAEIDCVLVQNAEGLEGDKVEIIELVNGFEEARYIAETVEKAIKNGTPKDEICILCRTHKQSEIIKQALELKEIKFISAGKSNILQKREIRTAIAYLSMLSNLIERSGTGDQAWWDLFHYKNTLSPEDSLKIGRYLKKNRDDNLAIDEALLTIIEEINISKEGKTIIKRVISKLKELVKISNKPLPEFILDIYELSGLNRAFSYSRSIENIESLMNLKKFHEIATNFYETHEKSLVEFIKYLEIIDSLGVNIDASKILHIDAVRIMTIHAVKGLEYDLVIVSNLAKNRFPLTRTRNEPLIPKELLPDLKAEIKSWGEIEEKVKNRKIKEYEELTLLWEERRLCYVAWTRAKKNLVLTYAKSYNNEPDSTFSSLFLEEIDYKNNSNSEFKIDEEELSSVIAPNSESEQYKSLLKEQLINSVDVDDIKVIFERVINYIVARDKKIDNFKERIGEISINETELQRHLKKSTVNESFVKFDKESFTFSPTALIEYDECPKKFELSKLYQMPQRGDFDEGGNGASTGSFVHLLCEFGVNDKFNSVEQFKELAQKKILEPEWIDIDLNQVNILLDVFWIRNKDKINEKSMTELKLIVELDGFKFYGLADRIDVLEDGTVEIIDYKTNKNAIEPKKRAWQLGFYALALQKMGYKVSRLTLDMLKLDSPVELSLNENGDAEHLNGGRTKGFNLLDVKKELMETVKKIVYDYEHGFNVAEDENACKFCGYKFYCPKWGE